MDPGDEPDVPSESSGESSGHPGSGDGHAQPRQDVGDGRDSSPSQTGRQRPQRSSVMTFLRELPILVLVALLLAFLLRTFVLQVFYIPSSSMEPTLQVDDRMVVEKVTFRFREPRRGDVVVFEGDDELSTLPTSGGDRLLRGVGQFLGIVPTSARDFVKRVIAVGGDEVHIEAGRVHVNGVPLDEPYVVHGDRDEFGPETVPDDHLFFLGDNRPNSSDSRRSLGYVPAEAVVGRAALTIWPIDHWGLLTGVEHDLEHEPAGG